MALHFSGNQFEQAYKPKVLRNWEVPKVYNDKPKRRSGRTQIIANDRGHLLPGVPKSKDCPWGNYLGTWHLPKKIDRKRAEELNGTYTKRLTCEEKEKAKQQLEQIKEESTRIEETEPPKETPQVPQETTTEPPQEEPVKTQEENKENTCPYIPGDFTDDKYRLPSHEILSQNQDKPVLKGYPRYRDDFSKPLPEIENTILDRNEVEKEYQNHKAMAEAIYASKESVKIKKPPSPIIAAIKNFQLAKKLHRENLEHDPLPDTITNLKYRKLQMQRSDKDPGLALNNENFATGVGWKGYPGYGPARCTKLKVYRPKTCGHVDRPESKNDGRPSSVTSFDLKWRFIRRRKVSPIELAICWDLTPDNPSDEPKRTPHIDGSNGSLAPAVFSLVHTPKEDSRKNSVDSGPIFEKGPERNPHDKDFVLDRPKTSYHDSKRQSRDSSHSGESLASKRAKSAYNLNKDEEKRNCLHCEEVKSIHQSTPNLSECGDKKIKNSRMCMACEIKNVSLKDKTTKKDEYKMAFKAGVPHKCKDKRQDYPEHWRLATVYQHSYKPIHARKRPLLATVFK